MRGPVDAFSFWSNDGRLFFFVLTKRFRAEVKNSDIERVVTIKNLNEATMSVRFTPVCFYIAVVWV